MTADTVKYSDELREHSICSKYVIKFLLMTAKCLVKVCDCKEMFLCGNKPIRAQFFCAIVWLV